MADGEGTDTNRHAQVRNRAFAVFAVAVLQALLTLSALTLLRGNAGLPPVLLQGALAVLVFPLGWVPSWSGQMWLQSVVGIPVMIGLNALLWGVAVVQVWLQAERSRRTRRSR
jgi:hypothetical protein